MPGYYGGFTLCIGDNDSLRRWGGELQLNAGNFVRELQDDLAALGFRLVEDRTSDISRPKEFDERGYFGNYTAMAVREFQYYAKAPFAALRTGGGPIDFTAVRKTANQTLPAAAPISGIVTTDVADLIKLWRAQTWNCPLLVHGFEKPLKRSQSLANSVAAAKLSGYNSWTASDCEQSAPSQPALHYAFDYSGLHFLPGMRVLPTQAQLPIVTGAGFFNPKLRGFRGGFSRSPSTKRYDEEGKQAHCEVTVASLTGQLFPGSAAFQSTFAVINAVCALECALRFDGSNGYDAAVLSVGIFNWTITTPGARATEAELPALLSFYRRNIARPAVAKDWADSFGRFGLMVPDWSFGTSPKDKAHVYPDPARKYTAHLQLTGPTAPVAGSAELQDPAAPRYWSDGVPIGRNDGSPVEALRTSHMFVRFNRWVTENDTFKTAQWDFARMRVRDILNIRIPEACRPAGAVGWETATLGAVFRSVRLTALLLRVHVNAPAHVVPRGTPPTIRVIKEALSMWTYAKKTQAPSTWDATGLHWPALFVALRQCFEDLATREAEAKRPAFQHNLVNAFRRGSTLMQLSDIDLFQLDESNLPPGGTW